MPAPSSPPPPMSLGPASVGYAPGVVNPMAPAIGSVLTSAKGSYLLRATLGSGEFGAVYEAIGPFDQVYAVKWIRAAARSFAEVQAEWTREIQRLLSLRHPNVVYIHDAFALVPSAPSAPSASAAPSSPSLSPNSAMAGSAVPPLAPAAPAPQFFLALERCDHALGAMLGAPMQEGLVLELARQLLAAVQFLHDNDVVHDDLHPGNVLVTHATDRPVVKIADFGISHVLAGANGVRPNVVHHAIMAPEVLETGMTTKQSDLYQVGLLLYWMLTGGPGLVMNASYPELLRQVSEGEPRKRAEAIGTPLGEIIARMLRRREQYRFTSAREIWNCLRDLPAWKERALFPAR